MILCDSRPLVALIDRGDPNHQRCTRSLRSLPAEPLLTTWSCWLEAIHRLGEESGPEAQECAWALLADGLVFLDEFEPDEWRRIRELMIRYRETPMDAVDASLVAAAERLGQRLIFTLDEHFRTYKIHDRFSFEVVPSADSEQRETHASTSRRVPRERREPRRAGTHPASVRRRSACRLRRRGNGR